MLDFDAFVKGYRSGELRAQVNRARAMTVCDRSPLLPSRYKAAHSFWKWIGLLLMMGGVVCLFWSRWYVGLGAVTFGLCMAPGVQKSAAGCVLAFALEDSTFYREMVAAGVLKIGLAQSK